jgi:hypothetical protein
VQRTWRDVPPSPAPALMTQSGPKPDRNPALQQAPDLILANPLSCRPWLAEGAHRGELGLIDTHPARLIGRTFPCAADIVDHHHKGAPTMPRPASNGISNLSDQPFVTMGGGALPLPMPTQPATLTATRVATKAISTFFIGVPLFSRHAMHTSCLAAPLVVRYPQWFTASVDSGAFRRGLCP